MHPLTEIENGRLVKCAAVVVTFHPSPENIQGIPGVARQFAEIQVVDNGSSEGVRRTLDKLAREHSNVRLHRLPENVGLATGLNTGVRAAHAAGFPWAALFDQDTAIPASFASDVARQVSAGGFGPEVALFAPRHIHPITGENSASTVLIRKHAGAYSEIAATISSGSIIDLGVHQQLNGFADELFVDYVDYDYSFRLRDAGHRQIQLDEVQLPHQVGERARRSVLGIPITVNLHSPLRQYYMQRNRLRLLARYALKYPRWAFREFSWGTAGWLALSLAGPERQKTFLFGLRGAMDAFRRRFGRYS